jgi:Uma2 family endonuclease
MAAVENPQAVSETPRVWPLSVRAYHALGQMGLLPEKTELLYGQIIQKMSKSPYHTCLQQFLAELIQPVLPCGLYLRVEQPITCLDSEPEPDLAVVCGNKADYRRQHPQTAELVIEVCVTSHEFGRLKLRAFAAAGVKECWFVLGPENRIEVHRVPQGDKYTSRLTFRPGGRVPSTAVPQIELDLDRLFAG